MRTSVRSSRPVALGVLVLAGAISAFWAVSGHATTRRRLRFAPQAIPAPWASQPKPSPGVASYLATHYSALDNAAHGSPAPAQVVAGYPAVQHVLDVMAQANDPSRRLGLDLARTVAVHTGNGILFVVPGSNGACVIPYFGGSACNTLANIEANGGGPGSLGYDGVTGIEDFESIEPNGIVAADVTQADGSVKRYSITDNALLITGPYIGTVRLIDQSGRVTQVLPMPSLSEVQSWKVRPH